MTLLDRPAFRTVSGLIYSAKLAERPKVIPKAKRVYGTKALGLSFEKKVFRAITKRFASPPAMKTGPIRSVTHGQWYRYVDFSGPGYCQPDVLIEHEAFTIIVECKLTDVSEAWEKLDALYIPVVKKERGLLAFGIVCVRHVTRCTEQDEIVDNIDEAVKSTLRGRRPVLHWLGRGPI